MACVEGRRVDITCGLSPVYSVLDTDQGIIILMKTMLLESDPSEV